MCTASLLRIEANCPRVFAPTRIAVDYFFLQEFIMILRMWHGYTAPQNADAYHAMLQETILPGLDRVSGYRGAYVARRHVENEVEFMTLTLWDSMDAVQIGRASCREREERAGGVVRA